MNATKRIKFCDITRLRKGDPLPEGCNEIAEKLIQSMPVTEGIIQNHLKVLKIIEDGKWYGTWVIQSGTFVFRHGVCQSATVKKNFADSHFDMNIINNKIDFRKDKTEWTQPEPQATQSATESPQPARDLTRED
jgi:hypothetical protein